MENVFVSFNWKLEPQKLFCQGVIYLGYNSIVPSKKFFVESETGFSVRKSNSGLGESFTSNCKLNRQKGCFSELPNSLKVTVNFSFQMLLFRLASSKKFE